MVKDFVQNIYNGKTLYLVGSVMKNLKTNQSIRVRTFIDDKYRLQHQTLEVN